MEESIQPYGLVLKSNLAIREFLELAVSLANTDSATILSSAGKYVFSDEVPYTAIRDIWFQIEPSRRPKFSRLLAGASFVLPSPKPREKSKELKDRLERLQEMADRKEYDALVRDVSLKKQDQQYFSSFKDQLGYGLHVIVIMFTGYLVGMLQEEFVDWCQLCCLRLYYLSLEVLVTRCNQRQLHYNKKEEMFQP